MGCTIKYPALGSLCQSLATAKTPLQRPPCSAAQYARAHAQTEPRSQDLLSFSQGSVRALARYFRNVTNTRPSCWWSWTSDGSLPTGSPLGFKSRARGELERVKRDAGEGGGGRRGERWEVLLSSLPVPLPPRRFKSPSFSAFILFILYASAVWKSVDSPDSKRGSRVQKRSQRGRSLFLTTANLLLSVHLECDWQ